MDKTKKIRSYKYRIMQISLPLIILAAGLTIFAGIMININRSKIAELENYLEQAETVKESYEQGLTASNEDTEKITQFLSNLRPQNDKDYITFVTAIEDLQTKLNISIEINSTGKGDAVSELDGTKLPGETIGYTLSFFGTQNDIVEFLSELEALPYYTIVTGISYENPNFVPPDAPENAKRDEDVGRNITISIKLFIKSQEIDTGEQPTTTE